MSRDLLEKVLHELSTSRAGREALAADPAKYLARHGLDAEEAALIAARDVRALVARGVNPMLTWGFWLTAGGSTGAYLGAMKGEA
jgi:hypothetical protein